MADGGGDLAAAAAAGGPSHPLQYRWTLWYDNSASARKNRFASWDENLTELMTFGTVEEFWALFNNILEPSNLAASSNYHLFKEGIAPKWEDPANSEGGKWVLSNPPSYKERLNQYWIHTVRAARVCGGAPWRSACRRARPGTRGCVSSGRKLHVVRAFRPVARGMVMVGWCGRRARGALCLLF